jgi:predicted lipoprotein with Yx(FWY)xxD motif
MGSLGINRRAALVVGAVLGALAIFPAAAGATVFYPPTASPAVKTAEGFELKGTAYDYGGTTTYHFEYGTTAAYGTSVPMPDADASGAIATPVSQSVTGLMPDTTYHYRLVTTNSAEGTATSADATFSTATTTTAPSPGPTPGETAGPNPYPSGPGSSTPTVGGSGPKRVAKALPSEGKMLLTTTKGRTLYSLSAERGGKFICTEMSGCTSIWHPLTVAAGVVPKGPVKLGTIHRPEGQVQVTYRGLPLYTFASDKKPGQVKGEGLKDVGTWHAALVPAKGRG